MDRASLEQLLGQGLSLAEIGRRFDRHEATVAYWVEKHGLQAASRDKHVAKGGLTREELEPLVEAGMSIAGIAEAVGRSKATVRHWLIRHGMKTHGGVG
jgi:transposase